MANTIKVKRGLAANRTSVTPEEGEFLYTTDTKKVFIGDGATAGGNPIGDLSSPLSVTGTSTAGAEIRLPEDTDNGSNYVALKAPDNIASSVTFTLPGADGTSGQVLSTNGSGTFQFVTAGSTNIQEFTASGTWTKPSAAQFVMVETWGAGGGGGGGRRKAYAGTEWARGGCGGGGGGYNRKIFKASELPSSVAVIVGAGGAGGLGATVDNTDGTVGSAGGVTRFGYYLYGRGGSGGTYTPNNTTQYWGGDGGEGIVGEVNFLNVGAGRIQNGFGRPLVTDGYTPPAGGYSGGNGGYIRGDGSAISAGGSMFGGGGGGSGCGVNTAQGWVGGTSYGGSQLGQGWWGGSPGLYIAKGGNGRDFEGGGGGGSGARSPNICAARYDTLLYSSSDNNFYWMNGYNGIYRQGGGGSQDVFVGGFAARGVPSQMLKIGSTFYVCTTGNVGGIFSTTDFVNWTEVYSVPVNYMAFGDGRYVVCSQNGLIATSTDLVNWTEASVPVDAYFRVKYDGTRFVAHTYTKVLYSTDGLNWTINNSPSSFYCYNVNSNGTNFVALVNNASNQISYYYSTDLGANWTFVATTGNTGSSPHFTGTFVDYVGGNFVVGRSNGLATSPDGITWTVRGTLTWVYYGANVAFNSTDNRAYLQCASNSLDRFGYITAAGTGSASTYTSVGSFYSGGYEYAGGAGGNGGIAGGGGGGGGSGVGNGGNGGSGGNGLVRVYSW